MNNIIKTTIIVVAIVYTIAITVTVLATHCNPPNIQLDATDARTLPQIMMAGDCTWVPDKPEPLIKLFNTR